MSPSPANFSAVSSGAVARLELLELRGGRIGLDLGRYPPRRRAPHRPWPSARAEPPGATRPRSAARAPRSSARHRDRPTSARTGIDVEMNAGAAAVGALAGRDAERIARARQHEIAVAAHRAGQRAHVAAESDIVQLERAAAGGVMQRDAAGQVQPVDRQRSQIERCRSRPASRSGPAGRGRDRATRR